MHIANLRRKIEPDAGAPRYIRTDPGVGYRFAGLSAGLERGVRASARDRHALPRPWCRASVRCCAALEPGPGLPAGERRRCGSTGAWLRAPSHGRRPSSRFARVSSPRARWRRASCRARHRRPPDRRPRRARHVRAHRARAPFQRRREVLAARAGACASLAVALCEVAARRSRAGPRPGAACCVTDGTSPALRRRSPDGALARDAAATERPARRRWIEPDRWTSSAIVARASSSFAVAVRRRSRVSTAYERRRARSA